MINELAGRSNIPETPGERFNVNISIQVENKILSRMFTLLVQLKHKVIEAATMFDQRATADVRAIPGSQTSEFVFTAQYLTKEIANILNENIRRIHE